MDEVGRGFEEDELVLCGRRVGSGRGGGGDGVVVDVGYAGGLEKCGVFGHGLLSPLCGGLASFPSWTPTLLS